MLKKYLKLFTLCVISIIVLSATSVVKAGTWLVYDDGEEDAYTCVTSGEYVAVKFTLPEGCMEAELATVSLFKTDEEISGDPGELVITVLGSDFSTELGFFEVILDPPGGAFRSFNPPDKIVVPAEFYIVMSGNPETCLGVDEGTGGHSHRKNGEWSMLEYDIMVRAEIECIYDSVGGELVSGAGSLIYPVLLIMVALLGVKGYQNYTRKHFM